MPGGHPPRRHRVLGARGRVLEVAERHHHLDVAPRARACRSRGGAASASSSACAASALRNAVSSSPRASNDSVRPALRRDRARARPRRRPRPRCGSARCRRPRRSPGCSWRDARCSGCVATVAMRATMAPGARRLKRRTRRIAELDRYVGVRSAQAMIAGDRIPRRRARASTTASRIQPRVRVDPVVRAASLGEPRRAAVRRGHAAG